MKSKSIKLYFFILLSLCFSLLWSCQSADHSDVATIMTVTGSIDAHDMGLTLEHEHVTTDFIGAEKVAQPQYPLDSALEKLLPFFLELKASGVHTLIECTPKYIGRDVLLLREISVKTGLNILTNTGYYAAVDKKYLPAHAYTETAGQLAQRWIAEWKNGIENTGVKPGFIKLGVGKTTLDSIEQKIVRAGALAHLQTGLTIAIHTGSAHGANEEIDILEKEGVSAQALIVVHSQNSSSEDQINLARRGCWISLDGISEKEESIQKYHDYLVALKKEGFLSQVLISHDDGWAVIQKDDGSIGFELFGDKNEKPYSAVFNSLIPKLKASGFIKKDIDQLLIANPANAFAVGVKII